MASFSLSALSTVLKRAAIIGQCGCDQSFGIVDVGGSASSIEKSLTKTGIPRLALRRTKPNPEVQCDDGVRVISSLDQTEGLGVIAQRIIWSEGFQRSVSRLARIVDRLDQIIGLRCIEPMAGEFTHSGARPSSA